MNTEGLTDEVVSSLLAMPTPEEEKQQRRIGGGGGQTGAYRRAMQRKMMMELSEGETPAATVIRSSKAPKVMQSTSTKRRIANATDRYGPRDQISHQEVKYQDYDETDAAVVDNTESKTNHKPVMMSACIRERSVVNVGEEINKDNTTPTAGNMKRVSRFKQRNQNNKICNAAPTVGGFPSLDAAPVGTFTRKGRSSTRDRVSPNDTNMKSLQQQMESNVIPVSNTQIKTTVTNNMGDDNIGRTTDSMLDNMSLGAIRDGVEEVTSILSAESIAFLRQRGQQKRAASNKSKQKMQQHDNPIVPPQESKITLSKDETIQLEEKNNRDEKEKMAELLSSVRSPEDMDRVYNEALELGLAAELPSSSLDNSGEDKNSMDGRLKNLHISTSLLRSTAPRQRLLGARCLCDILEEDAKRLDERRSKHSFSGSCDEEGETIREEYPQLLPVAIRCLLDESIAAYQTAWGRLLLTIVLRCIHALMTLCAHPYHVVKMSPGTTGYDDPFILYQTCFMGDVSHVPPGTELYSPTQIKPLDKGGETNAACYRADSSAATAESDSKSFYSDPAWTLLSRMRILPCLSDVMVCLSSDYSTGIKISDTTIQSICGILAMLAVRSPGAAGAIARHKSILPFLVSYCLSPSNGDNATGGLFNTGAALPALILLNHLARQSKDIAELEMPFTTIISDMQAILCIEANDDQDEAMQMWCIILLRVLMRYGLALEHVQTIISLVAPRVDVMQPGSHLGAHYLMLFANICNASRIHNEASAKKMPTISEVEDCLAMSGVWLSSPVQSCITSFKTVANGSDIGQMKMKLASAQLQFMASYISTAKRTMSASSFPIVSKESCFEVVEATLESRMLENALTTALGASYNAYWVTCNASLGLDDESIGCAFVSSFMNFVKVVGINELDDALKSKLLDKISYCLRNCSSSASVNFEEQRIHPARQSWFIESEFSILSIMCEDLTNQDDTMRQLLAAFAFSLVGRLNIGYEAIAAFIFSRESLFQTELHRQRLQSLFLLELGTNNDRKQQLNHSSSICLSRGTGPLSSLRCTADFVGGSTNTNGGERFFLPLGGIWMYNVLSSTTSRSNTLPNEQENGEVLGIMSHTLSLLLQLEQMGPNESKYITSMNYGAKLYHITNVCLFPEIMLSDDYIGSALKLLFQQYSGVDRAFKPDPSLVRDFVKACFMHSRVSRESKSNSYQVVETSGSIENKLQDLLVGDQSSSDGYTTDELRALDDFVDDVCSAYLEYGGQYVTVTHFVRLFLRHDFPAKVITTVLTKLHPILNALTIEEEEEDRGSLHLSLSQSISGGLPSMDSSRRDPSSVLDSFSSALKKKDKELSRYDYVYLLAIAVLSRNFASSSQRCECGLEAMKNRLTAVSDSAFYDIACISRKLLRDENVVDGTKDSLITIVLDQCMHINNGLKAQGIDTQNEWQWNSDEDVVWNKAVGSLTCTPK